jgi:hypothetical protein
MKSTKKQNIQEQLDCQKEWCNTVLKFIEMKEGGNAAGYKIYTDYVNKFYLEKKLEPLKCLVAELIEGVSGMSESKIQELDRTLIEQFGTGIKSQQKKSYKKVQSIIKKGKITNEDEYRLVLDYIDQIYADSSKEGVLQKLNVLLNQFDDDLKNR